MGNRAQRFGINIGRGWMVLVLLAGTLLLAAYWIGPLRPIPAHLELLAIDGDVAVEEIAAEPRRTAQGRVVFPIPLAVRNIGARTARPAAVVLSLPPQFGVSTSRGRVAAEVSPGVPLRRFRVPLAGGRIEPDSQTQVLAGLDTIYLEPDLPRYYCSTQGERIPEFGAAPRYNAQTISDVRIFYSFVESARVERQTGLLNVSIDPELLEVAPAAGPPTFPTVIQAPEAGAPETGTLLFAGARTAHCGDPEQPVELYTTSWETMSGGRVFVVYVDNVGRKRLYDLNRDGIIELETWDADADGLFEARREARFAIPDFLMPLPPRDPAMAQPDPVAPDSAWLALFHDPGQGLDRFATSPLVAHPQVAVADTAVADTAAAGSAALADVTSGEATAPAGLEDLSDVRPATPQFLALFADTASGPFRFSQRARTPARTPAQAQARPRAADTAAATPGVPTPGEPSTPGEAEPVEPEPEPEPEPAPAPRRRQPLGTPIDPPR